MLLNRIEPDLDPNLRKNQNSFRTKRSTTGKMLTIRRILEGVTSKNLPATLHFIDFSQTFDSINREKMKDILIIYSIPTEIVNAILMLYKNTRSMVRSPDGDTSFFDITTGVIHGHKRAQFICIICIHYILKKSMDSNLHPGFTLSKEKAIDTLMYTLPILTTLKNIAVIINSLIYANKLLNKFEDMVKDIGLHIQSDKTE